MGMYDGRVSKWLIVLHLVVVYVASIISLSFVVLTGAIVYHGAKKIERRRMEGKKSL